MIVLAMWQRKKRLNNMVNVYEFTTQIKIAQRVVICIYFRRFILLLKDSKRYSVLCIYSENVTIEQCLNRLIASLEI